MTTYISSAFLREQMHYMGLTDPEMVAQMEGISSVNVPLAAATAPFIKQSMLEAAAASERVRAQMQAHEDDRMAYYNGSVPSRPMWERIMNQTPNLPHTTGFVAPTANSGGARQRVHPDNVPPGITGVPFNAHNSQLMASSMSDEADFVDVWALRANLAK